MLERAFRVLSETHSVLVKVKSPGNDRGFSILYTFKSRLKKSEFDCKTGNYLSSPLIPQSLISELITLSVKARYSILSFKRK